MERKCVVAHSTLFDNPHIDHDAYISTLKASCGNDPSKIAAEIYGRWDVVQGAFFSHYLSRSRSEVPWLGTGLFQMRSFDYRNVYLAMDWGIRAPSSCLLLYRCADAMNIGDGRVAAKGSWIVVDEVYTCITDARDGSRKWDLGQVDITTTKLVKLIHEMCDRNGLDLSKISAGRRIADAQVGALTGNARDGSIGSQLADLGCRFIAGNKGPRADGLAYISHLLEAAGDGSVPGLYMTAKAESIWATFPYLQHATNKPGDCEGVDHSCDALRYCLMTARKYRGVSQANFRTY